MVGNICGINDFEVIKIFAQLLVGGLMVGCIYALVALGFNVIYNASALTSFVNGEIFMMGAFVAYTLIVMLHMPFLISLFLALIVMFIFGMGIERVIITPMLKKGAKRINILIATIGLSIFLQNVAMILWGSRLFSVPAPLGDNSIRFGTIYVNPQYILIMGVTLVCMVALYFMMQKSTLGKSLRAAAQDPMAASVMGINVSFTIRFTWALAAVVVSLAGILLSPIYGVYYRMGATISTKGFAAAVVGGYGNLYGSIIGGLLLGIAETIVAGYLDSAYKDVFSFVILIIVLITMPTGILKSKAD